jgi:O-methyltransferase involved in polyketide biosynthesis
VLAFKADALATRSARPATRYQPVSADVRADWPPALRQAGFDPSTPTAWSAEGLLPNLTAAEQDLVLQQILALSAPGSRIAVESLRPCERLTEWLTDQGWEVTATEAVKLMERYGRPPEAEVAEIATRSVFIEARLSMVSGLA